MEDLKRAVTSVTGRNPALHDGTAGGGGAGGEDTDAFSLAMQLLSQGALEQAELILEEAQALSRHVDDRSSVAQTLTGLGLLAQRQRQWEQSAPIRGTWRSSDRREYGGPTGRWVR